MTEDPDGELLAQFRAIVGRRHVLTTKSETRGFTHGYRYGAGPVLAVVRPGSLVEQFKVFEAAVKGGAIVIVQAANTGLTGGSTPHGEYDRSVVVINTLRIGQIHLIHEGRQVVCLAGATLYALERKLAPLGREPHSVIGSSCIGASVVGGVCNNSGGALVRRGPAYTELALYARVTERGEVQLVNHLGIAIPGSTEAVLAAVDAGNFAEAAIDDTTGAASSSRYSERVRNVEADTPARFNADPERLFEAAGSAGKVMVLAVRLDTFVQDNDATTFYVGTNDVAEFDVLRRRVLTEFETLPVSGEYIHRQAFDVAARYGKDVFVAIERFGTDRLPALFAFKSRLDAVAAKLPLLPPNLSDRVMQVASRLLPGHLPPRMREWRDRYEHHLILKVAGGAIAEARALLDGLFPSPAGGFFECSALEARKAFLHRFAVAGAAIRYRAIHHKEVGDIIALDIALRRNDRDWFEHLPGDVSASIAVALYYGHFFCHVFHQDYIVRKGVDPVALEHRMWEILDRRGAEYPAEHNVGHLYPAKASLTAHYLKLDPGNRLNPGIGWTSRKLDWQ